MILFKEPLSFWLKVFALAIIQMGVGFVIFHMYPLISMLFLGEGADSALYSNGNSIMWIMSPIILPTMLNTYRISNGLKNKTQNAVKMYIILGSVVLIVYLSYIIWWAINRGFHI